MTKRTIILSAIAASLLSAGAIAAPAFAADKDTMSDSSKMDKMSDGADMHKMTDTAANETLYKGAWTKKSFKVAGDWSIVRENGKTYIDLSADFKTRNAPDLKVFLSPQEAKSTTGKNATDGALLVAPLSSNKGAQRFELPEGVDLASYKSVLIHCHAYSKLWSAADLIHEEA
ncbi:MAG: DM13 domain-containing protein [Pseudomonadota bacterium]